MNRPKLNPVRKFERLEDRRMMTGDISFSNGVLTVNGGGYDDIVEVRFEGNQVDVDLTAGESGGGTDHTDRDEDISDVQKIVFNGLAGKDRLTVFVDNLDSGVNLNNVALEFHGGENDDTLTQLQGGVRTIAFGDAGRDILQGSRFNDILEGGVGNDDLSGGVGNDTYVFKGSLLGTDNVIEDASADNDTLDFNGMTAGVTVDLTKTGTNFAVDSANLKLKLSNNTAIETVFGTAYDDKITGNSRNNFLHGRGGNDTIIGGAGADELYGDGGSDSFTTDALDHVFGGAGIDVFDGFAEFVTRLNPRPGRYMDFNRF